MWGGGLGRGAVVDHDHFHMEAYNEALRFDAFVAHSLEKALDLGVSGKLFLDAADTLLQKRFSAVSGIEKHLFWQMVKEADPRLKKIANTGLFFLVHEVPGHTQEMYEMQHPWDVILARISNAKKATLSIFEDASINTDPETGLSLLSDKEMFERLLPALASEMDAKLYTSFVESDSKTRKRSLNRDDLEAYLNKNMQGIKMKRTKWRIDMWVTFNNGKELYVGQPTAALALSLNDDFRMLLSGAGFKVPKPTFNGDMTQNLAVLHQYNKDMRQAIRGFYADFEDWAKNALIGDFSRTYFAEAKDQLGGHIVKWTGYEGAERQVEVPSDMQYVLDDLVEEKQAAGASFWEQIEAFKGSA